VRTAAENASDEVVMGAVWVLCEFSLLVSQQNHSNLSLKVLDDELKRFYQKKGICRELAMWKSAKANVNHLLAMESHLLREQKIHTICTVLEALVYGADKVSTTKHRQFQVYLNRAHKGATTCSDADCPKAIERLERKIHQVTPAKRKRFDKLFQRHV
jgi:hypothetical protein